MNSRIKSLVAAAAMALAASANAGTVMCGGERMFSLTSEPTASCFRTGTGNISGNGDAINDLGFTTIDKSDSADTGTLDGALMITGQNSTSGTFTINPIVYTMFDEIVLGFKVGQGQLDPDWAAFLLADGTVSGSWLISGRQALSHANLYGRGTPGTETPPGTPVSLPGTLAMLGIGFAGIGAAARKRKPASV